MDTGSNRVDALVVAAKGVLGAVPIVGPIVAEVVGAIIPNQRIDRIARLLEALRRKVADQDQTLIERRMKTPEGVDLLEDAFHQAARALSDERLEYIADVLKKGISDEQAKQSESKSLMWLLGQLSDPEVILLAWFDRVTSGNRDEKFEKRHSNIIEPPVAQLGSSQEEIDNEALHNARKAQLVTLGLLRPRFRHVRKGESPEFDERTGMMKASGHDVTALGRLLLRTINPQ
ncbi:MAG: hypothetical protein KKB50_12860 [Planctomycetes bacterium]|nr:hypothetical protein [Planctomycetota bacterium]